MYIINIYHYSNSIFSIFLVRATWYRGNKTLFTSGKRGCSWLPELPWQWEDTMFLLPGCGFVPGANRTNLRCSWPRVFCTLWPFLPTANLPHPHPHEYVPYTQTVLTPSPHRKRLDKDAGSLWTTQADRAWPGCGIVKETGILLFSSLLPNPLFMLLK